MVAADRERAAWSLAVVAVVQMETVMFAVKRVEIADLLVYWQGKR